MMKGSVKFEPGKDGATGDLPGPWVGGELSSEALGLLVGARQAASEAFGEVEGMLVDAAVASKASR